MNTFLIISAVFLLLNLVPTSQCFAQTGESPVLARRVYVGIRMENLTEDSKRIMQLGSLNGVLISEVLPKSTAEEAGFKRGDILLSLNGQGVQSTSEVLALLAGLQAGKSFAYELYRNKSTVKGSAVFKSFPEEQYPDLEVQYTASQSSIGKQRIILSKPRGKSKTGKFPLLAFIGGMGCYSLDLPLDTTRSEVQLTNALCRAGYMCARLEKPGMGDNAKHCKPCAEVSLNEETEGYVQAIEQLKKRSDVDSNAVYIIGHSMGGVFAPIIAQKTSLKGIIAYGTIGSNLPEHLAKTRRSIAEADNLSPEETDSLIKDFCECTTYYFADTMTSEQAAGKKAICRDYMGVFDLRSRAYNNELYALSIPSLWKGFRGKALLLWGECDFVASGEDHRIITNTINYYHKGNGEYASVKNADHGMNRAENFRQAKEHPGSYNPDVAAVMLKWLKKQS